MVIRITVLIFHSSSRFLALGVCIPEEAEPVSRAAWVHHLVRGVTLDIAVAPTRLIPSLAAKIVQDSVASIIWVLCNGFLHHSTPLRWDLR